MNGTKVVGEMINLFVHTPGRSLALRPKVVSILAEDLKNVKLIGLNMEKLGNDVVNIKNKSPLQEFMSYLKGYAKQGEDFIPTAENKKSLFLEYFNHRKSVCVPKDAISKGKFSFSFGARQANPKILLSRNPDEYMSSLIEFLKFVEKDSKLATKEEYFQLVDEIANLMPNYVKHNYPMLRKEIVDNADKIFRWHKAVNMEQKGEKCGELLYGRFFDKARKDEAIREYVKFLEDMTGKKVLIGSPTRMGFAIDSVTLYNNPKVYKDIDCILLGHGTGSSFADVNNPNTWRFSDTGESIWTFIEREAKGKKILVTCCEEDAAYWKSVGRIPKDYTEKRVAYDIKKDFPEMLDKNGQYMDGIGNPVRASFGFGSGAKICESGTRHILGTVKIKDNIQHIFNFIDSTVGDFEVIKYAI